MYEIPLFPLNTVLFPGMPLPLQIFEDRYKRMIQRCIREKQPFGVVLVREGVAEHGPLAEPHLIGCTAQITQVQPLDDTGRMLIMTIGRERFRIVELRHDEPYLVGLVESAPLQDEDSGLSSGMADKLYEMVLEYLQILADRGQVDFDADQVPTDAETLAYLAASVMQLPPEEKQSLLAANTVGQMVRGLCAVYARELPLLRLMPPGDQGIFSLN